MRKKTQAAAAEVPAEPVKPKKTWRAGEVNLTKFMPVGGVVLLDLFLQVEVSVVRRLNEFFNTTVLVVVQLRR